MYWLLFLIFKNYFQNSFQRHFLESSAPLKLEDLTDWASELNTDPNNTYNLDSVLAGQADLAHTSSTSTTCLEEILQSCSEVFLKRLKKYFF